MKLFFQCAGFCLLMASNAVASVESDDFQTKYLQGKEYYKAGKYGPAMETFLPVTRETPGNNYEEYAQYFYALSAFRANKMNEAYQMLLQLINKYPQWNSIDDACYLAANTSFELKKYRYGLNFLKDRSPKLKPDIDALKENYFIRLYPIDSLKAIQRSYPTDPVLAKVLLKRLLAGPLSEQDQMLSDYLQQEFKIPASELSLSSRKSTLKDSYNVAVLFPFMVSEIATEAGLRSNPYAAEMFEGIKLAIDSLKSSGIKINLYAYDTEKDNTKIQELLKTPELKSMDLLIGPLIPAHNGPVNQFAISNLIETVNPLSNNSKLTEGNEFVYLFQPTLERQAQQVAAYAEINFPATDKQKVLIFYSDNARDSLLALNYRDSITARKYTVTAFERVSKDKLSKITLTLSDSATVVEVNHIFVASADQVVAANVISALEISQLVTPVFTRAEWLQFPLLSFEQLQRRQIHFIYPDFADPDKPALASFKRNYISKMNNFPNTYVYTGYELMTFFGKALKAYGNYFKDDLNKQGFTSGILFQGNNYSFSNDNKFVPIVKFEEDKLKVMNSSDH
jgi:hypothetical protein